MNITPNNPSPYVDTEIQRSKLGFLEGITSQAAIGDDTARGVNEQRTFYREILLHAGDLPHRNIDLTAECHWRARPLNFQSGSPPRILEGMYFQSTNPSTAQGPKQAILLCTGSHLPSEEYAIPMVQSLTALGHDVMIFNYSGFGNSEGDPSEKHVYEDSVNAYDEMARQAATHGIDAANTKAIGYSLGGAAAAYLATKRNVDVVLDRTFTRASDVADVQLREIGFWKPLRRIAQAVYNRITRFNTTSRLSNMRGRCMVMRGTQDQTPPITQALINTQRNRDNFTLVDLPMEHHHHVIGMTLLNAMAFPRDHPFPRSLPPAGELWYGNAPDNAIAQRRTQLDDWLRRPNLVQSR